MKHREHSAMRRIVVLAGAVSAIAAMGIVGVAAEASAKPIRDTTNNGICTEINQEIRATIAWIRTQRSEQMKAISNAGVDLQRYDAASANIVLGEMNLIGLQNRAVGHRC